MGGHDHGHKTGIKIPDYTIYKVEDVPELKKLQERLAEKGLKDPWARNYVWRFQGSEPTIKMVFNTVLRGVKYGVPAFLLTIAVEKFFGIEYGHGHKHDKDHGHGHEDH